jgi:hypothetical protein
LWAKLTADPKTRMFLQQPDFVKMIQDVQKNPNNINLYLSDQRMMQVLGVLLNVNLRNATSEEDAFEHTGSPKPQPQPKREPEQVKILTSCLIQITSQAEQVILLKTHKTMKKCQMEKKVFMLQLGLNGVNSNHSQHKKQILKPILCLKANMLFLKLNPTKE